ncbi:hypothetical protein [Roseateles sp.]|uniref:hypothetical protein n=1 Tax=Roseateles sp. TaxID=1971397 RepID=UPI0025CE7954|nr:hypothetical protein [Roseateles sp.]MBV8035090.1 hypothetical protein [Roseateles sp.]
MPSLVIANGELWLHADGTAPQQITSPFAREVMERDERSRRSSAWKHAPREQQTGVIPTHSLWGSQAGGITAPPRFLHACFGPDTQTVYYVQRVGEAVGLFRLHVQEQREVRLFHKSKIDIRGLAYHAAQRHLILGVGHEDGTAQIEVYDEEGTLKGAVTGGDSIDAAPSVVPGAGSALLFQSSGVARHAERGFVRAVGHSTLCRLDYRSGSLEVLADDARYDFLAPRIDGAGAIHAIRRPIEKPAGERAGSALTDTLLFPVRLLKAVFGFLNVFSMIYGKEPLRSAGGPRTPELDQDVGKIWLQGRLIDLQRVRDDPQYAGKLVPASWELVRRRSGGDWEVLARHVLSFDLAPDGAVVYSNGIEVLMQRGDAAPTRLAQHEIIESVAVG